MEFTLYVRFRNSIIIMYGKVILEAIPEFCVTAIVIATDDPAILIALTVMV